MRPGDLICLQGSAAAFANQRLILEDDKTLKFLEMPMAKSW
jgi:hypothetical protein